MADKLVEEAEPQSCRRCLLGPTCHQSHDRAAPNCGLRYTAVSRFPCQTAEAERSTGETIDRPSAIKRKRLRSAVVTEEPESKRQLGDRLVRLEGFWCRWCQILGLVKLLT